MATGNSTERFSNRVADYVRYRPHYPKAVIPYLQQHYGFPQSWVIADIGAGTGISSLLFLEAGYEVVAVEPNREMREQAMELLGHFPGFRAVAGTAEEAGLPGGSVDAIIAAQAYHWFDAARARAEWIRIGKPGSPVVLMWNERQVDAPFEQDYDRLIHRHGRDYVAVQHRNISAEALAAFYAPAPMQAAAMANSQVFDFEGLAGRLTSSSYMPARGEAGYDAMIADLRVLFDRHAADGRITLHYQTLIYSGRLS